jgi:hypothetical protein
VSAEATVKLTLTELRGGKVHARIDQSPYGASEWPGNEFEWPTEPGNWFRKFMDDWQKEGSEGHLDPTQFGRELHKLVFDDKISSRLASVVSSAKAGGNTTRLALSLAGANLGQIPFELLHDGQGFLIYSGVRIVRMFDELSGMPATFGPFRRLLVVLAEPNDQRSWGHDKYKNDLKKVLQGIGGLETEIVPHATKDAVLDKLRTSSVRASRRFDAVYIIAHGEVRPGSDAELLLEDSKGASERVPANVLAQAFQSQPGCFVYLNSCSTAAAPGDNPFAGFAQRLMRDGGCGAVLAMQKPILVSQASSIARSFFRDLARGNNAEIAAHWAVTTSGEANSWIIPCLHTRPSLPGQERLDRISAFFSADPATAVFAFFLPAFRMGFSEEEYRRLADSGQIRIPEKTFNYKGTTNARSDILSAAGLISLLGEMLPPARAQSAIQVCRASELTESKASHLFLFGSKSHDKVQAVLHSYSTDFAFSYKDPETSSDEFWQIKDLKTNLVYKVPDPSRFEPGSAERNAADEYDYAVIEKIVDRANDRVFFILAGLQDRGTRGAGEYLIRNWEALVKKYGASSFQVLLKFAPGLDSFGVSEIERETDVAASK